jgi:hypothetical protein
MKITKLQIFTLIAIIASVIWELKVQEWASYQPNGGEDTVRVDQFVIVPLLLTLIALSVQQLIDRKNKK